ncbi:uncharacterized protein LOC113523018 [Galleria mellonella]|uniref:Uncharacterized protein LOC113523018 n=1 Tax=Galleria mellonella TaxID=7137 RepID=A0A6J3C991_GALME|nr:uncharacterized protein LOC113523018 [Galleria mellonella]
MVENQDYGSSDKEKNSQIEVRAVLINYQLEESDGAISDAAIRFQREELFKHSVLGDCNKKLALTVKITNDPSPDLGTDDEYIPIEHVFDGSNKKRVRLLNPYVLRIRREKPLQAYRIRSIDTVSGILISSDDPSNRKEKSEFRHRAQRDNNFWENNKWFKGMESRSSLFTMQYGGPDFHSCSNSLKFGDLELYPTVSTLYTGRLSRSNAKMPAVNILKRDKRQEHNIIIEQTNSEGNSWDSDRGLYKIQMPDKNKRREEIHLSPEVVEHETTHDSVMFNNKRLENKRNSLTQQYHSEVYRRHRKPMSLESETNKVYIGDNFKITTPTNENFNKITYSEGDLPLVKGKRTNYNNLESNEKEFGLFEIDNPCLWNTIHVQLFEKRSTPEGKTVWNDLTNGDSVSIGSISSQWTGQDVHIRYRPTEWIPRKDFSLSSTSSLRLLVPLTDNDREYIIVPIEDVMGSGDEDNILNNHDVNTSQFSKFSTQCKKRKRKVLVHVSRRLLDTTKDNLKIVEQRSQRYLTLPYQRPHQIQIDLEARADENQLILVGCSGRIATVVADSTRRTRTILTIQASNMGLAAARFRIQTRHCDPDLSGLIKNMGNDGGAEESYMLAPMYTKRFRLELPIDIPVDVAHCSVALVNDDDVTVAMRDVTIKKRDRCFCVWYCDCVCLSDDPKLLCREMSDAKRAAAGLPASKKSRHVRSVCYPDIVFLNLCVIIVGVLITLLFLGFVKACVGLVLRCVGSWGLERLLVMPRKLERYYESSLSDRPVIYDEEGWPVHPDTKRRTVRLVNKRMEFILNIIIFIVVPCLMLWDVLKHIASQWHRFQNNTESKSQNMDTKNCFNTIDLQGLEPRSRRRRGSLRQWMTPQAEDLTADIWHKGLSPQRSVNGVEIMRPLLYQKTQARQDETHSSCLDSEQDDTEYVLMQMKKSRESLARTQMKSNDVVSISTRKQNQYYCKSTINN